MATGYPYGTRLGLEAVTADLEEPIGTDQRCTCSLNLSPQLPATAADLAVRPMISERITGRCAIRSSQARNKPALGDMIAAREDMPEELRPFLKANQTAQAAAPKKQAKARKKIPKAASTPRREQRRENPGTDRTAEGRDSGRDHEGGRLAGSQCKGLSVYRR